MIAILFASTYKNEAKYYKDRSEELARTSQKKALVDLQRQKLVLALEQTNHHYRLHLGHLTFYRTDARNRHVVHTENIITGRRIRTDFIKACEFAWKEMGDFENFKRNYSSAILSKSGIASAETDVIYSLLDEKNKQWFDDQVRETATVLYEDTIRLQEDSKEGLAKYYQENLSEVEELQKLANGLATEPTRETIDLLVKEVNHFVVEELERQHVQLLRKGPEVGRQTK